MAWLWFLVAVGAGIAAYSMWQKASKYEQRNKDLEQFSGAADWVAKERELKGEVDKRQKQLSEIEQKIASLRQELEPLELDSVAQEFGLYEPKYDLGSSARYKAELDKIRARQKDMVKSKAAYVTPVKWIIEGSEVKGRKMLGEITQLQLRAFNGESEALIQKVRFDNVLAIQNRLLKLFEQINKLDGETGCHIASAYLDLKVKELHLLHEYREKKEAERVEQQEIREQMREEAKAQKELERAQAQAAAEERQYNIALEAARRELEKVTGVERARLQAEIERLNIELREAHERNQRAISMAQQTRAGHVYVISNMGSFGEDVYKIGMTRRLEPMERVKELSSASVPFEFDVHAVIYSSDAPKLEAELHRAFDKYRVNKVNTRKEFFKVPLSEVERVVKENHGEIDFTLTAEAHDYRQSRAMAVQA